MSTEGNTASQKGNGGDTLGITFNEIHADEPQEGVSAQKLEKVVPQTASPHEETSHLSNHGQLFNVAKAFEATGRVEAGTFVSDKKRDRPGFIDNLKSAMHEWWNTTKASLSETVEEIPIPKPEPKPMVAKVETRTEVVKKAAEKSALAPKDDHKVVIQKIRTFKQDVARATNTPVVIKQQGLTKEQEWKHEEKPTPEVVPPPKKPVAPSAPVVPSVNAPVTPAKMTIAPLPPPPPSQKKSVLPTPPQKTELKPIPTPPLSPTSSGTQKTGGMTSPQPQKGAAPTAPFIVPKKPTPPPPLQQKTSVAVPAMSVPPTVTKKAFTPPPQSVIVPQKSPLDAKKVTSEPIAASWQNGARTKTDEPKPFIYTKKDLEKSTPFKFGTQSSVSGTVQKTPLSTLKNVLEKSGAAIHEMVTPPPQKSGSVPKPPSTAPLPPQVKQVSLQHTPELKPIPPQAPPTSAPAPQPQNIPVFPNPGELKSMLKEIIEEEFSKRITKEDPRPAHAQEIESKKSSQPVASEPIEPTPPPVPQKMEARPSVPQTEPPRFVFGDTEIQRPFDERMAAPRKNIPRPMTPEEMMAEKQETREITPLALLMQSKFFRHSARLAILGIVAVCGVTLAVVVSIYFNIFEGGEKTENHALTIPSFFTTTTQVAVPLSGDPKAFLARIHTEMQNTSSGPTQFYGTLPIEETGVRVATSKEMLTFLNVRMGDKTIRALDDHMMIGSIRVGESNQPFIIIRSYTFDTLFAGLLLWEKNMHEDLASLFGEEPIKNAQFVDAVRDNASTRILYKDEQEVMLYSFINQNTVVITSSGEALAAIIANF